MKKNILIIAGFIATFVLGFSIQKIIGKNIKKEQSIITHNDKSEHMKLGAFSISLSVKDLKISKQFYESLGFTAFAGTMEQNYLIMKNDNALVGLFQGMFQGNMLTFNPGWDEHAQNVEKFDDIRTIQQSIKTKGIQLSLEADEKTSGPASMMLTDPDGNVILIDQHR